MEEIRESIAVKEKIITMSSEIENIANIIIDCLQNGGKILLCGNGGSAADCQHIAGEFVNRFRFDRNPLPAISLVTDSSVITAIGNDYSFDDIFSKQVEALGEQGDVLIGISTSGNSKNVIKAFQSAKQKNIKTIGFTGDSGSINEISDICFCVPSSDTPRIQEAHITILHVICGLVENSIFKKFSNKIN